MRKFNVNVNGNSYVVEVEEIGTDSAASAPVAATAPAPAAAPVKTAPTGGTALKCPMPGKILKTLCKDGDKVTKNQKLLVLEAMKMENDVVAPADGVVTLLVKEGDDVV
ncbi:MAG: biotin/lipoyl-containing protein, partial [Candidatus Neoclostridium sp.]